MNSHVVRGCFPSKEWNFRLQELQLTFCVDDILFCLLKTATLKPRNQIWGWVACLLQAQTVQVSQIKDLQTEAAQVGV